MNRNKLNKDDPPPSPSPPPPTTTVTRRHLTEDHYTLATRSLPGEHLTIAHVREFLQAVEAEGHPDDARVHLCQPDPGDRTWLQTPEALEIRRSTRDESQDQDPR